MSATDLRQAAARLAAKHLLKWNLLFFIAGFVFDIYATREGVDHALLIVQQIVYLGVIGAILYVDFVREARPDALPMPRWLDWLWRYRSMAFHFCLGTLMNLYSIFFLMSASAVSSLLFVVLLFGAIVLNEMHVVQHRGLDVRVAFYVLCIFCFWSLMIPIVLHSIGRVTFLLSFVATLAVLAAFVQALRRRIALTVLVRRLVGPGLAVSVLFLLMYLIGLIPPVPIAAKRLGVYHKVERVGDEYRLSYIPSWWRPWHADDRHFVAEPGDVVNVFFAIYSPTRFDDTVFVRWSSYGASGWKDSDRIPIRITGGREEGFRGVATKENYTAGEWRVVVETRDGREISRLRFSITKEDANPERTFKTDVY